MILRRAIIVAVATLISSAAFSSDCVMGHYSPDQRSWADVQLRLPMALNWEYTATKFANNVAAPIAADGVCYISSGNLLTAVDAQTGKFMWQYPSSRPLSSAIKATPAYCQGSLFFGTGDGIFYCIGAKNGALVWKKEFQGAIRCPPVVDDGVVYFGSDDDCVHALDCKTGTEIWSKPFMAGDDIAYGIAVGNGIIVATSMDGVVYGINAASGKARWKYRLSLPAMKMSPILNDTYAILPSSNMVYAFNSISGNQKWTIDLESECATTPACDGTSLYVLCKNKKLYAYTLNGRAPIKKWVAPGDFGAIPTSSPVVTNDTVIVAGNKGVITAFNSEDGTIRWRYMVLPAANYGLPYVDVQSSPCLIDGRMFVLSDDGVLHCFSKSAPDSETPMVFSRKPLVSSAISNVPPFKVSAIVYDIGSGVDFNSLSLTLDEKPLSYTVDVTTSTVSAWYGLITDPKSKVKPDNLTDGPHTLKLRGTDYAGNPIDDEWTVFADSRLPAPKQPSEIAKAAADKGKTVTNTPTKRTPWGGSDSSMSPPSPPPPPPMPAGIRDRLGNFNRGRRGGSDTYGGSGGSGTGSGDAPLVIE